MIITAIYLVTGLCLYVEGQPQCLNQGFPFGNSEPLDFCSNYESFGCCTPTRIAQLKSKFNDIKEKSTFSITEKCEKILKDLLCQECSPFALRIYNDISIESMNTRFPSLCPDYCESMLTNCDWIVASFTTNQTLIDFSTEEQTANFCGAVAASNSKYCFDDVRTLEDDPVLGTVQYYQTGDYKESENCTSICVTEVLSGLRNPLTLKHANDQTYRFFAENHMPRIFVGEQPGTVTVYNAEFGKLGTFLNIEDSVLKDEEQYDERGFLDIVFHPNYKENGRMFVCYSFRKGGENGTHYVTINEVMVSSDQPNEADLSTEKTILEIQQPEANHNGGQLLFGDDGFLYIFSGDGGGDGDPWGEHGNAQNTALLCTNLTKAISEYYVILEVQFSSSLLGKVLRIDVDNKDDGMEYKIPSDNPFINSNEYLPEIFALGIRNSWRCSKDRGDETGNGKGRIFCGDVGQEKFEEINLIKKGANYGWKAYEGNLCYDDKLCQTNIENLTPPIYTYAHPEEGGRSITGGYVYRGCGNPNLQGTYLYGDFVLGKLFSLKKEGTAWKHGDICLGGRDICYGKKYSEKFSQYILAFGEDAYGEVYILSTSLPYPGSPTGSVYKIVDPSRSANPEKVCDSAGRHGSNFVLQIIFIASLYLYLY